MRAKKVEKDEGMDSQYVARWKAGKLDISELEGSTYEGNIKPKRRNGRLAWKPRALQAEKEAQFFYWGGLVLVVVSFFIGVNVGLYAF